MIVTVEYEEIRLAIEHARAPEEERFAAWLVEAQNSGLATYRIVWRMRAWLDETGRMKEVEKPPSFLTERASDGPAAKNAWNNWIARGRPPEHPVIQEALVAVLAQVGTRPPGAPAHETFESVLADVLDLKQKRRAQVASKLSAGRDIAGDRDIWSGLHLNGSTARDTDASKLGLTSAAHDQTVPPYVSRTRDQMLAAAMVRGPIVTVVGAPDAGKTRSVFEVLKTTFPHQIVWWAKPEIGALGKLAVRIGSTPKGKKPAILVLDDAQNLGTTDGGLNAANLAAFTEQRVIVILRDDALAAWQAASTQGRAGAPSHETLGVLLKNTVSYAGELDAAELASARALFPDAAWLTDRVRLGAVFAAPEETTDVAREATKNRTREGALVEAARQSDVAFPDGVPKQFLERMTRWQYGAWRPHAEFEPAEFTTALRWATEGTHSLLTRNSDDTYSLTESASDALADEGYDWSAIFAHRDELPPDALLRIGESLDRDAGAAWLEAAARRSRRPSPEPPSTHQADQPSPADGVDRRSPLALVEEGDRYLQFEYRSDLVETVVAAEEIDGYAVGRVILSPDASVIATLSDDDRVDLWTVGADNARPGPALRELVPGAEGFELLAVERPLGQSHRLVVCHGADVYSLVKTASKDWRATLVLTTRSATRSAAPVADDVLLALADGSTQWLSGRGRSPFSLREVRGVDSALGKDGRFSLVGWGTGSAGREEVVIAVVDRGVVRVLSTVEGYRAGLVRASRQMVGALSTTGTAVAVRGADGTVRVVPLSPDEERGQI